jgi:hypothetical protein
MKYFTHLITAVVVFVAGYQLGTQRTVLETVPEMPTVEPVEEKVAEPELASLEKLSTENQALRKVLDERNMELAQLQGELSQAKALVSESEVPTTSLAKAGEKSDDEPVEEEKVEEETSGATPLLTSIMKMKDLRGDRHSQWRIDRKMEALGDLDLSDEQKEKVGELLKDYHTKAEELGLLALDPNVSPEEILMKAKALHEESLNSLSVEVDLDKAKELLGDNESTEERGVENLQRAYQRMKLTEEQKKALEFAAQDIVKGMPELGISTGSHRSSSSIGPETTWEEVDLQRQFVDGVDTVSGLIKKSLETRHEGQLKLLGSLEGNENFDEATLEEMKKASDRSQKRSERWVGMVEAMENDPEVIQSMMKLRETFGRGR